MKQPSNDFWIVALMFILCCSLFLNYHQNDQISKLSEKVENLEYIQSVMSSNIDDLERRGGVDENAD